MINDGSLTVALDPELTPELIQEGLVRDLVRGIQNLRKDKGLDVTDRIELTLAGLGRGAGGGGAPPGAPALRDACQFVEMGEVCGCHGYRLR